MPIDRNLTTAENVQRMGFDDIIPHGSTPGKYDVIKSHRMCFGGSLLEVWDWMDAGCPEYNSVVTHDGGPDVFDGAENNGDLS